MGPSFRRTRRRRGDELQACEKKKRKIKKTQRFDLFRSLTFFFFFLASLFGLPQACSFVSSPPKQVRFFALLCRVRPSAIAAIGRGNERKSKGLGKEVVALFRSSAIEGS